VLAFFVQCKKNIVKYRQLAIPALVVAMSAMSCRHAQIPLSVLPASLSSDATGRGEVIVRDVAVCGGCHAADSRNPDGPLSGGKEFQNWIGIARAPNLTSDSETGLGAWSEAEIVRAIRNGQRKDGRLLAPIMPYEWFQKMSDNDVFAVARYLKTLPPVRNDVRQSPNLVFRLGKLFLSPASVVTASAPPRGATAQYGAYLSQYVALCAECHTPRGGLLQKPDRSRLFAGVANPPNDFPAKPTNLTPDPTTGIGRWSEEDFISTIRTGKNPTGRTLHAFMPWPELKRMPDDDLRAIYRYLMTVPPIRNNVTN